MRIKFTLHLLLACIIKLVLCCSVDTCAAQSQPPQDSTVLKVMYFHGTIRCQACLTIEKFAEETMKNNFHKELQEGTVTWQAINYQKENDKDYTTHYGLENQALVVSKFRNGKEIEWRMLEKVWELLGDYRQFQDYIVKNVKEYMPNN